MNFSSSIYGIFSTLTPREGSGFSKRLTCYIQHDFNSRSSHGERYHKKPNLRVHHEFQFSLPVWGAVILYGRFYLFHEFQFTFPAWGAITVFFHVERRSIDFNSRSLRGERSNRSEFDCSKSRFQFSPLREERWLLFQKVLLSAHFQFSLPVWGAICAGFPDRSYCNNFNSRSLHGERYMILHCSHRF